MTHSDLDRFHSDPANWKYGIFYFCRSDPRILVPKRIAGLGWTVNFGQPKAVLFLCTLIALIFAALALTRSMVANVDARLLIKLLLAVGIFAFCHRLAHRPAKITESKADYEQPKP